MTHVRRTALLLFLMAALGCLGCDQLTKGLARTRLAGAAPTSFAFGTVHLSLAENPGAFLSLGAALPESLRRVAFLFAVPAVLLGLCVAFLRRSGGSLLEASALGLVVGGGAGNWLDRLLHDGAVTDFVRLGTGWIHTGVFNLADVAIVGGLALLVLRLWRGSAPA